LLMLYHPLLLSLLPKFYRIVPLIQTCFTCNFVYDQVCFVYMFIFWISLALWA
jgi:hypothetical protein